MTEPFETAIYGCARCGADHSAVTFEPFTRPIECDHGPPFTHYGFCPASLQPILMRRVQDG